MKMNRTKHCRQNSGAAAYCTDGALSGSLRHKGRRQNGRNEQRTEECEEAVAMHKELMAQENAILSEDTALWEKVFHGRPTRA